MRPADRMVGPMTNLDTSPPADVVRGDLGSIATRAARRTPDETALVEADSGRTVTFAAFDEATTACADALRDHCEAVLAPFERPKAILGIDSFPYTATGKIAKARLELAHSDHYE